MTTYSKRRRGFAAVLAALLLASLLAVVSGSPASAANTAYEVLNADKEREFAGQDRYDTALRLAKNFATFKGGLGAVPTVFIASGDTLVDSISVAGLAGYVDAPILLTPSGSLHGGVADFIEDYGVSTVYVLGGSAAISDATVTAIEGLATQPKTDRVAGDNRYATAVAIAAKIATDSSWCDTTAKSAVLINGSNDMLAYGVAVQAAAFRLQLPLLMTEADELPDATADFIQDNDIEHVQIVGGTGAVSSDVESALVTLGVDTVERVDGDTASAVSVAMTKLVTNGCGDDLGLVDNDMVALVRGNPDGVASAPVLAGSLAGDYLVPALVVGDSLPASVRDYLASTPKTIGTEKLNLGIVAIGGKAAISQAVMDAALKAAASAGGDLTVKIGATEDTDNSKTPAIGDDPIRPKANSATEAEDPMIRLYFSDAVATGATANATNTALLAMIRDVLRVNDVAAKVGAATLGNGEPGACSPTTVTVRLDQTISAGDVISIAPSTLKFGAGKDQRTVGGATATVVATPADRTRPTVSIVGIAGAETPLSTFTVTFNDAGGFPAIPAVGAVGAIAQSAFTLVPAAGKGTATNNVVSSISYTAVEATANAKKITVTVTIGRPLEVGDRLVVKPGAIADAEGNMSAGASQAAIKAQASPAVTAVQMSTLDHSVQTKWAMPDGFFANDTPGDNEVTITAKKTGDAAGAAGNDWQILFDTRSTYKADGSKTAVIAVSVDPKGKRVSVEFVSGPITIGDLLKALKGNSDFDARFMATTACGDATTPNRAAVKLDPTTSDRDVLGTFVGADGTDTGNTTFASAIGRTRFAIEVRFDKYIREVADTELLNDVLNATALRNRRVEAADTAAELVTLLGIANNNAIVGGAPGKVVRYQATTASVTYLPKVRDLVDVAAGSDQQAAILGPPAYTAIPDVAHVALGYLADQPASGTTDVTGTAQDRVDEDENGASQRRISISSNVKPFIAP